MFLKQVKYKLAALGYYKRKVRPAEKKDQAWEGDCVSAVNTGVGDEKISQIMLDSSGLKQLLMNQHLYKIKNRKDSPSI